MVLWLSRRCVLLAVGAALLFVLGGCDTSVNPFVETEEHFSVHGYLLAGADTQFVRVQPLRDPAALTGRPPSVEGVRVTLARAGTGREVPLRDSLVTFPGDSARGGGQGHVFYTAALEVRPEETYRLTVRREGGGAASAAEASTAQTTVPPAIPEAQGVPTLYSEVPACDRARKPPADLFVPGIDPLVKAELTYRFEETGAAGAPPPVVAEPLEAIREGGGYRFVIDYDRDVNSCLKSGDGAHVDFVELAVGAGSADWPDYAGLDPEDVARPDVVSNVEGGVGFFGAVVTRTVTIPVERFGSSSEDELGPAKDNSHGFSISRDM